MDALKCCVIWNLMLSCCLLNRLEQTRSHWKCHINYWDAVVLSPSVSPLLRACLAKRKISTCQIKLFTSNLSHSFQRHCSAFLLVISELRYIWSSSTEELLNCPSSPYERGQNVCAYCTDQCNAQTEGLGLSLLWCVMNLRTQIDTACDFLVMKFTVAASPRHVSYKH